MTQNTRFLGHVETKGTREGDLVGADFIRGVAVVAYPVRHKRESDFSPGVGNFGKRTYWAEIDLCFFVKM